MLIADVFKVQLLDPTNSFVFASATMSTAGFEVTNETNDVEGGGGLVSVLHLPKKENITLEDVRFNFELLAKQLGSTISTGAVTAYTFEKEYTVVETDGSPATNTITLDEVPKDSTAVKIYKSGTLLSTGVTFSGTTVTFADSSSVDEGDVVTVQGYEYTTSATAQTITIDNSLYPTGVKCILETIEIDEDEVPKNTIQCIFDKCLFTDSVSIDTETARKQSNQKINLKVINKLGQSKIAGRIVRIPIV